MMDATDIGTIYGITLATRGGYITAYLLDEHEANRLDAEWARYVDGGKTCDRVVEVTSYDDQPYKFLLSALVTIECTTRESRRRMREFNMQMDAERREDGVID